MGSSSPVSLEAAPKPPQEVVDLDHYFRRLMLRELDNFRGGKPQPADDDTTTTITTAATEVADTSSPPATGQDPTNTMTAEAPAPVTTASDDDGEDKTNQPATAAKHPQPQATTTNLPAAAAAGFQGKPLKLVTIPNKTDRQRKNNGARQQRVYRLAAKFGVSPGSARWVRNGKPFAQPAVPRSVVRTDSGTNNTVVEYNQFIHDGEDSSRVMLRMPGGWKRDLVRNRAQFVGVAVIDGFLWPRFSPNLSRRMTVDWEEQGFVEFNEVTYTTPFVAREPRPAQRISSREEEEDGILIRFDE